MVTVEQLQAQLKALQEQQLQKVAVTTDDIKTAVKAAIVEELGVSKPVEQPTRKNILGAIGCSLTQEEQLWFSDIQNLSKMMAFLPDFLQTYEGSNFIKALARAYREFYEN